MNTKWRYAFCILFCIKDIASRRPIRSSAISIWLWNIPLSNEFYSLFKKIKVLIRKNKISLKLKTWQNPAMLRSHPSNLTYPSSLLGAIRWKYGLFSGDSWVSTYYGERLGMIFYGKWKMPNFPTVAKSTKKSTFFQYFGLHNRAQADRNFIFSLEHS